MAVARGSLTGEKTSHPEQQRKNIFLVRPLLFPILLALPFSLAQRGLGDAPEPPSTEALSTCCNVFVASPWVGAQSVTGFGVGSTGGWPRVAGNEELQLTQGGRNFHLALADPPLPQGLNSLP